MPFWFRLTGLEKTTELAVKNGTIIQSKRNRIDFILPFRFFFALISTSLYTIDLLIDRLFLPDIVVGKVRVKSA